MRKLFCICCVLAVCGISFGAGITPIKKGKLTNNLDANGKRITGAADPVDAQDLATRAYILSLVGMDSNAVVEAGSGISVAVSTSGVVRIYTVTSTGAGTGDMLSVNNLREDLSVAFETADRWVTILENLYFCFRIQPYGLPKLRAARKEKKLYMWDWSLCDDPGPRFENLVASNLLKYCHFIEDGEGDRMELRFVRDSQGRELDFVVLRNDKPEFAVECKTGERDIGRNIVYFAERTGIPRFYQVHQGQKDYEMPKFRARVLPMTAMARELAV